jgi:hypothetical protein
MTRKAKIAHAETGHWIVRRSLCPWTLVLLAVWCFSIAASACSVPVFRYALDHWEADPYRLEIPYDTMSRPEAAGLLRPLGINAGANVQLAPTDGLTGARLFRPGDTTTPLWSGQLDEASVHAMVASPARTEIVKRILAGHSLVWVVVESGEAAAAESAAATLEKRLGFLKNVAQLPVMDPGDPANKIGPGPELKIQFSVLRVKGDDPAEQIFLKSLAGPKGLPPGNEGTWLATVFGRGRVLGSWLAKGFGDEEIDEVCLFLLGACSCQVKNQNPGWDLLLGVDWNTELLNIYRQQLAAVPDAAPANPKPNAANSTDSSEVKTETVTISAAGKPDSGESTSEPEEQPFILWIAAGLLLVVGGFIAFRSGSRA